LAASSQNRIHDDAAIRFRVPSYLRLASRKIGKSYRRKYDYPAGKLRN